MDRQRSPGAEREGEGGTEGQREGWKDWEARAAPYAIKTYMTISSRSVRNKCLIKAGGTEASWKEEDTVERKASQHLLMSVM